MNIDIIGGGIGGLTTAIALEQKGIQTQLFEQSEQLKPVGAGIILANNAMQVYEKLGLRKVIEEHGNAISSMNITDEDLKPISKVDLRYFEQKHKVKNIAIHRGTLQQILLDHLKSTTIHLNHRLEGMRQHDDYNLLTFQNGQTHKSECTIGADGLNSTVRHRMFPETRVRNAKQICWRGITQLDVPKDYTKELNEAWGKADRFGFVQIAPQKVYWYALKSATQSALEFDVENIGLYFQDYTGLIQEIIASTPKQEIHTAEILDVYPNANWYSKRTCLLGDAAHATTPNMGQGACQAIEDAWVLANCLDNYEVEKAFAAYQSIRLPKAHRVVKASWTLGKLAHWKSPLARKWRNEMMRRMPNSLKRRQSERLFTLETIR